METFPYGKNMDLLYVIFRYTQYQPDSIPARELDMFKKK